MEALLEREVLFFGGKGGVGKTTLATAVALVAAQCGLRTLLVSTDPAHSTADMLGVELGPEPRPVAAHLWAMEIDPSLEADRYIAGVKERLADVTAPRLLAEVERQIDIARVTPGAEEAALFERFTRLIDEIGVSYDRVIFDTAPLGHTLRLLALPEQMSLWMEGLIGRRRKVNLLGRMWRTVAGAAAGDEAERGDTVLQTLQERKSRFERARTVITDGRRTAFVFVVIPERLPILETHRAVGTLARHRIPVGAVIVNRVSPDGLVHGDDASAEGDRLREIERTFSGLPLYHVPRCAGDIFGMESVRTLAGLVRPGLPPTRP
jgi:arsenite-transporting ATPase